MLKKVLVFITVLTVALTLVPAALPVSAETDPEGTVIVYNDTVSADDERFVPYNSPWGGTAQKIAVHGGGAAYEESKLNGYNGRKALQLLSVGYGAWYMLTAANDASLAGTYDIYVWNVCEGNDTRRNDSTSTHPDYHAQYDVVSTNGETRYYIDQKNASGGKDGWVKLGTHYFSGSAGERVAVSKNYDNNSSTYLSAVKFVPVNKPSSAKLTHMYMRYNGSARIETEDTPITSNIFVKQFPSEYADSTKKISIKFETEDPDATVKFDWGNEAKGATSTEFYADPAKINYYNLIVTSEDGTVTETYRVGVGVDSAEGVRYYSVGDDNYSKAYNGSNSYDEGSAANPSSWKYPAELTGKKSNAYNLGDVSTWKIPNADIAAGRYSLYVWSMAQTGLMDENVEVIVNHSGLRETKAVTVGNYHYNNAKWAYAGDYYFDGTGNESVSVMKVSNTNRLAMAGIKLAPSAPTRMTDDFDGISVSTSSETVSITKDMLSGKEYVQPLANGDYTSVNVKVIGSHPQYEYIKLNGNTAAANADAEIPVNASGETSVKLEIKLLGKPARNYKFVLFKEFGTNAYTQRVTGAVSNLKLPISADFSTASGKDAKYIAEKGNVAGFPIKEGTVDIIRDGFYKILVWKPSFNYHINSSDTSEKLYASSNQPVKINTGNKSVNNVIDWTGTDSQWVDLGNYLLNKDGITGNAVEFTGVSDAYTMLNEAKFLKLSDGVLIDNEFITLKELDDKVIYTGASYINITPYISGEPNVYINDMLAGTEATNIVLNDELSRVKIRVINGADIKEYNIAVVKSASVINWDDENVNVINNSATEDGTTGYNGSAAAIMNGDSAVYKVKGLAKGETKVFVYGIPVDEDKLSEIGMTGNYNVSVTGNGVSDNKYISAPLSEGWIEIGTYNFDGTSDEENITISADEENVMYLNCIKLEAVTGGSYVTEPVAEVSGLEIDAPSDGNASAWVYAYNKTDAEENVTVILAVYDKETNMLAAPVAVKSLPVAGNVVKIATEAVPVADSSNVYMKAFVWNGASALKPLRPVHEISTKNN